MKNQDTKDCNLTIRVPKTLKEKASILAKQDGRTLSNYIRKLIIDKIADDNRRNDD